MKIISYILGNGAAKLIKAMIKVLYYVLYIFFSGRKDYKEQMAFI